MAHLIEDTDTMISVKKVPWHGLGVILDSPPTVQEAITKAGLDWKAEKKELFLADGSKVKDFQAIVRNTDNMQLGVTGQRFEPLQNSDAFDFFNPFITSGQCSLETAGSLRNGKTVWVLAKLNRNPIDLGSGDTVDKFLLLSNSHDGKSAVKVGFTPIRVVCNNTLTLSHNSVDSKLLRVWHSKRVSFNLEKIQEIVNIANESFEATAEQFKFLANAQVNQNDLQKYVKQVFYNGVEQTEERAKTMQNKLIEHIASLFENGQGSKLQSANGTFWGLYNSVTEYLSHDYGRNADSRLNALWFGANKDINASALEIATTMAKSA